MVLDEVVPFLGKLFVEFIRASSSVCIGGAKLKVRYDGVHGVPHANDCLLSSNGYRGCLHPREVGFQNPGIILVMALPFEAEQRKRKL